MQKEILIVFLIFYLSTKDYGGFMDTSICELFFGSSLECRAIHGILILASLLVLGYIVHRIIGAIVGFAVSMGERKRCPECKKGILKQESFDRPEMKPNGEKHTYRDIYLICQNGCGHTEKIGESELIA